MNTNNVYTFFGTPQYSFISHKSVKCITYLIHVTVLPIFLRMSYATNKDMVLELTETQSPWL